MSEKAGDWIFESPADSIKFTDSYSYYNKYKADYFSNKVVCGPGCKLCGKEYNKTMKYLYHYEPKTDMFRFVVYEGQVFTAKIGAEFIDPSSLPKTVLALLISAGLPGKCHNEIAAWLTNVADGMITDKPKPFKSLFSNPAATFPIEDELSYTPEGVRELPGLKEIIKHPVTGWSMPLWKAVINLNDKYHWKREQIADWLETLDVDIRFKMDDKEN